MVRDLLFDLLVKHHICMSKPKHNLVYDKTTYFNYFSGINMITNSHI